MKQGRTLDEVEAEVRRQARLVRDFRTPTNAITVHNGTDITIGDIKDETGQYPGLFTLTEHTHNQIGTYLKIPAKFYDMLRAEQPDMLDYNVNELFRRSPKNRMVRTLEGKARAFLSDRYQRRDHIEMLRYVMPELREAEHSMGLQMVSCEITERKLYLKFTTKKLEGEVQVGDVVQAGGVISNSEIGEGYIEAYPFITRLICLNGAIIEDFGQRKAHIGRRVTAQEEATEIFSDETLAADDHAFWLKIRDSIRTVLKPESFQLILHRLRETAQVKITANPENVVEELSNRYVLDTEERGGVLRHLIDDGVGYTKWGLANAITSVAGESGSYDRATELERLGGTIVNLQPSEWKELVAA